VAGLDPLDLVAGGGEDYELLAALPRERVEAAVEAVAQAGTSLTEICELSTGAGVELRDASGRIREVAGFDHLRTARGSGGFGRSR
jgi:thiamine-monophosphate kinase